MQTLLQDVRYGVRLLLKNRGFTIIAVLTLALGIGANSAIFSVVNAVLLRPLTYKEPDRIVQIWETNPVKGWTGTMTPVAPANFFDWERQNQVFEGMAAYAAWSSPFALTGIGEPERLQGMMATGNFFSVLGVGAALGRTFLPEETWEGKDLGVVLSHGLWRRRFGGDPKIIGQTISLNGRKRAVIGVMPEGFYFPTKEIEVWAPWGWNPSEISNLRRPHFPRAIARLKPGVSLEQARAEMTTIARRLEQQYPDTNTKMGVGLGRLHEWIVSDTQLALLVLLAAVGFVLLIACANVANLLLARAATRAREIAVRTALGASRVRLVRQMLTESLLLSVAGGALGLLFAMWGRDALLAFSPGDIPRFDEISLDGRVLAFTLAITLLTTLIFGLTPALASSKADLTLSLKEGGQKGAGSSQSSRARSVLVVLEIALSLVLVIAAGLMIRSFLRLQQVNPGFDANNILTLRLSLPESKYQEGHQQAAFYQEVLEHIKTLAGVQTAGAASGLAMGGVGWTSDFTVEGRPPEEYGKEVRHREVSTDYFRTMGIPLARGRLFTDSDQAQSPVVVVINETLARRFFAHEDPIGKRLKFGKPQLERPWYTIVGVVKDEKQERLSVEVRPEIYQSHLQRPQPFGMNLVVRTAADPHSLIGAIQSRIRSVDKDLLIYDIKTMKEVLYTSVSRERFTMLLLVAFAAVALILAVVGIYGVMAYAVAQRTREIGIHVALGAQAGDVRKLIVGQGMTLALIGVGIGLLASFALTRWMKSLLFGVSTTDPATFGALSLLLAGAALLACYIPARRAARVDPMVALRYE